MSNDEFDSLHQAKWIDRICDEFERSWVSENERAIEPHLVDVPEPVRTRLLWQLIAIDVEYQRRLGESPTAQEYVARFPELSSTNLKDLFETTDELKTADWKVSDPDRDRTEKEVRPNSRESSAETDSPKRIRYFGDYEIVEKIARGGMGTVYRARQISLNRIVAVKMINSGQFASKEEVRRFYSEAEAAASLDHPNIVPVYEVGEFEGNHFFSMAFVDGSSLYQSLSQGPMKPEDAAKLMRTVSLAVQFAHDQGVIHRDLKPSNILLDRDGRPRISDFGLAKRITDETGITVSGDVLGTPSFMPPEQAAGKINAVGFRSDVYSLGAILYSCLSGRPPFQSASHVDTLRQVIDCEPVALRRLNPAIPRDLETATHHCLEKSMSRRYESPKALADDLDRFLAGAPISARPINSLERGFRWCRNHPAQVLNIAGLIVIFAGAIAGWLFLRARESEVAAVENAVSLLEQLNVASVNELPKVVQLVQKEPRTKKLLDAQYQSSQQNSALRYRAAISLLPVDANCVNDVCSAWINVSWSEWVWIRDQLSSYPDRVFQWTMGFDTDKVARLDEAQHAKYEAVSVVADLYSSESSNRLTKTSKSIDSERVVSTLLDELRRDPSQMSAAANAFFPARDQLGPSLSKRMDYSLASGELDASIAASLTAELFGDEPEKIFEYGWNAKSEVLAILFGNLKNPKFTQQQLRKILDSTSHGGSWAESNALDRRRAIAATILFKLGDYDSVWPLLCHQTNPSVRSLMMEWIPLVERSPAVVLSKLRSLLLNRPRHCEARMSDNKSQVTTPNLWLFDEETSQLRALLQILGNYPIASVQRMVDEPFWTSIESRFEIDPDPGIHASCEWLLRRHGRPSIDETNDRLQNQRSPRTDWFVNSNGHVMAIINGPIEFTAGADRKDPDRDAGTTIDPIDGSSESWSEDDQRVIRIPRSLEIALHETRLYQLNEFDKHFHVLHNKTLGPTRDHPACKVSWHKAAAYCNWLSIQEGIPEHQRCFIPIDDTDEMRVAPDYLHRIGYRLPTEAEWEYVCRAGTLTRRYFGETDELLDRNTWYMVNSREKILAIPGSLKPNELGLFETLGNVAEWCIDDFDVRTPGMRNKKYDVESPSNSNPERILRGGSIYSMPEDLRASEYSGFRPSQRNGNTGFRIARTIESLDNVKGK